MDDAPDVEDPHRTLPAKGRADDAPAPADDPYSTLPPEPKPPELSTAPCLRQPDWRAAELVGHAVGPWVLEELLGEGGWGAVFRAVHCQDASRRAAIKLPKLADGGDEQLARFRQEIRLLERIHHTPSPHVVGLLDADSTGDPLPWLALELIDTDLQQQLGRRRKLPIREALTLALGILAGLSEAHRAGVVHRDLKPSNILRTLEGEVRIADFGIARRVAREGEGVTVTGFGLTVTGQQVGTVHYMSPEAIEGKPVETPGDVYSFGALLYTLLTGRPPFRGSLIQVYNAHFFETPAPISDFVIGAPPELDDLVLGLLAKASDDRPTVETARQTIRDVLAGLERAREETRPAPAPVAVELRRGDEIEDDRTGELYTVVRELGRGGMGIVYAVVDRSGEQLALKVAGFNYADREQARRQLIRDANNAIQVTQTQPHPAVASVLRVGAAVVRKSPIVFLVSQLVNGPSLAQRLEGSGPLEDALALAIWIRIAEGLAAIHEAGVLHLDLSPGNILLESASVEGKVQPDSVDPKIVDFGISRQVESQTLRSVEGNPAYMSPEQCEGLPPTFASDIYMLGATFYHVTTGRPVFSGDPMAVMSQHRHAPPRRADLETAAGYDLALVIHKCLFKNPEDRYVDAASLVEDLRQVGKSSFPRSALKAALAREERRLKRRAGAPWKLIGGLVVVGLLIFAAAIAVLVTRGKQDQQSSELTGKIENANEGDLLALHERVQDLRHYDPAENERLEEKLEQRTSQLMEGVDTDLRRESSKAASDPGGTKLLLERLRDGRLEGLRATQREAPTLLPDVARLSGLRQELAFVLRVCDLGLAVQAKNWDLAARLQGALEGGPDHAQGPLQALRLELRNATHQLEGDLATTLARVRQLQISSYDDALAVLNTFKGKHHSWEHWKPVHEQVETVNDELVAAKRKDPFGVAAERTYRDQLAPRLEDLAFEAILSRATPTAKERQALGRLIGLLEAFGERRIPAPPEAVARGQAREGETKQIGQTLIGKRVARDLQRADATFSRWAAAAWARTQRQLRSLRAQPPEPRRFQTMADLLGAAERAWTRPHPRGRVVEIPQDGAPRPLTRALSIQRLELATRIESVTQALLERALKALRRHTLVEAGRQVARLREYAQQASTRKAWEAVRPAVERVAKQVDHLSALNRTSVVLKGLDRLPPNRGPDTPTLPSTLRVDPTEAQVRTYALFLEVVRKLGPRHRAVLGCHADEPPTDHQPLHWADQRKHPLRPVRWVTWYDAVACARWAGRRLPTAPEWEAIARGPRWVQDRRQDWLRGSRRVPGWRAEHPLDVRQSKERVWSGVYDTAGNVAEWCSSGSNGKHYCGPDYQLFGSRTFGPSLHDLSRKRSARPNTRERFLGFRMVRTGSTGEDR